MAKKPKYNPEDVERWVTVRGARIPIMKDGSFGIGEKEEAALKKEHNALKTAKELSSMYDDKPAKKGVKPKKELDTTSAEDIINNDPELKKKFEQAEKKRANKASNDLEKLRKESEEVNQLYKYGYVKDMEAVLNRDWSDAERFKSVYSSIYDEFSGARNFARDLEGNKEAQKHIEGLMKDYRQRYNTKLKEMQSKSKPVSRNARYDTSRVTKLKKSKKS